MDLMNRFGFELFVTTLF